MNPNSEEKIENKLSFWQMLKISPIFLDNKQRVRLALFILSLCALGWILPQKFLVSITPSLRYHIFYLYRNPSFEDLRKNDYVVFIKSSHYIKNGEPLKLIKQIKCDAGEYLIEMDRNYYCISSLRGYSLNDVVSYLKNQKLISGIVPEYLGKAKTVSKAGQPLDNFQFRGQIPGGMCYVAGDHPDSFDSRYFGFIDKKTILAKAYPII